MSSMLKKMFKKELVRVYVSTTAMQDTEEGMMPIPSGIAYKGFIIDSDDNFVILGDEEGTPYRAISHNIIETIAFDANEQELPDLSMEELN